MTASTDKAVIRHEIGEGGVLSVRFASGSIEVTATEGSLATVRDLDGRDLDEQFHVDPSAGHLELRARDQLRSFILGRRSSRLAVEVPRKASLTVETASADIGVDGVGGAQRYNTASGRLVLRDVAGTIALDVVSGTVDLTAGGPIALDGRVVSGDVAIRGGSLERFKLQTTSGDATIDSPLAGPGPFSLQTVSGDGRVSTPGGVRVEATTLTGRVETDRPHSTESGAGRTVVKIGDGRTVLRFASISGDLRVVGADDPAPIRASEAAPPQAIEKSNEIAAPDDRLAILRELEDGRIDVAEATRRLASLERAD